ncbi:MAG: hypothetical protein D6707_11350 [Bacteroidetes bacterium]|nr:MAG: hypothetical protein D6707_11350 [Bacteroidota bacterium]
MNKQEKARLKEIKQISQQLVSGNAKEILKALEIIPEKGDEQHIPLLLDILTVSTDEQVKTKVLELLFNIKVSAIKKYVIQYLKQAQTEENKQQLLSVIWQAGLDVSEHLDIIIDTLISGNYLTAIEAFTVLEECMNHIENKELIENSIKRLKRAIVDDPQSDKIEMLSGIIHSLNEKIAG